MFQQPTGSGFLQLGHTKCRDPQTACRGHGSWQLSAGLCVDAAGAIGAAQHGCQAACTRTGALHLRTPAPAAGAALPWPHMALQAPAGRAVCNAAYCWPPCTDGVSTEAACMSISWTLDHLPSWHECGPVSMTLLPGAQALERCAEHPPTGRRLLAVHGGSGSCSDGCPGGAWLGGRPAGPACCQ